MKLVRRVQRELEAGNDVFIEGGMPRTLELEMETIQQEVRRLISRSQALSQPTPLRQGSTEPCTPTKASCEPQPETVTSSCKFLGGTGRRRWRKCNNLGQFMDKPEEVMARPSTAPTSNMWVVRSCHYPQLCPCEDSSMYLLTQIRHVAAHQLVMLTHHAKDL